jgi:hypothetical protein
VLRRRLPDLAIVDLTHGIPPQDVRAGSLALLRSAPYLAPGVVIAVVDPGVGTARRPIAVATAAVTLVGPDNGLLPPAVDALGAPSTAVVLEDRGYWLPAPGPTFAGRDIFAPAAGLLAAGHGLAELGSPIDAGSLVRLPPLTCRWRPDGSLELEVAWVDRYGNVQLSARPADIGPSGSGPSGLDPPGSGPSGWLPGDVIVTALTQPGGGGADCTTTWSARAVSAYAELAPGQLGLLCDSYGYLALCLNGAHAARLLGLGDGDRVLLRSSCPEPAAG